MKDARIRVLDLPNEFTIERCDQLGKLPLWALRKDSSCSNKKGRLSYEPMPSNRSEKFLKDHRFASPAEAYDIWEKYFKEEIK